MCLVIGRHWEMRGPLQSLKKPSQGKSSDDFSMWVHVFDVGNISDEPNKLILMHKSKACVRILTLWWLGDELFYGPDAVSYIE